MADALAAQILDPLTTLTGVVRGDVDGAIVVVEASPTRAERLRMREVGFRQEIVVAAGRVGPGGEYEVAIPTAAAQILAGRDLTVVTYGSSGFPLDRSSISRAALLEQTRTVDVAEQIDIATSSLPPRMQLDIEADTAPASIEVAFENAQPAVVEDGRVSDQIAQSSLLVTGGPCGPTTSCCQWEYKQTVYPWVLINTAGTNTRYAYVSATFEENATSKLGWHFKSPGNSAWQVSTGTRTISNSGQSQVWAETNRYGLNTYEMQAEYDVEVLRCWQYTGTWNTFNMFLSGHANREPVGYTAGDRVGLWFGQNQYFPTWCVQKTPGTFALTYSRARSYPTGVQFSPLGASSESGYSTKVELRWRFTHNKWLCGETNFPGSSSPDAGKIMADWTDR